MELNLSYYNVRQWDIAWTREVTKGKDKTKISIESYMKVKMKISH